MLNPFAKRATEYLRDDVAFLGLVTPEPLMTFFKRYAQNDTLYVRLAVIIGTPGSGKTTLARLFQYQTLRTLLDHHDLTTHKSLVDALTECHALADGKPIVSACRLPLEAEYREFWNFPYEPDLKFGLMSALLQARSVLGWIRGFNQAGIPLEHITIIPRPEAEAALQKIGGTTGEGLKGRAREVEMAIYRVSAALIPPAVADIDTIAPSAYRPFDVIEAFKLKTDNGDILLRPLAVFDDAHSLHPDQLAELRNWLCQREIRIARWILTRVEALSPTDVLTESANTAEDEKTAINPDRDITHIWLQGGASRTSQRRSFKKMARDMSARYLAVMDPFKRRSIEDIGQILGSDRRPLADTKITQLGERVGVLQRRYHISDERIERLKVEIDRYFAATTNLGEDVKLAMLAVLMARYAVRTSRTGQTSFLSDVADDPEPNRPLIADAGVAEGAEIHLLHKFDRAFYHGFETLCDASSENAEQFLQLVCQLVVASETQMIRGRPPKLTIEAQNTLLREQASQMIKEWSFPLHQQVRLLVNAIGIKCLARTLEDNASLGGGASAAGILQDEFNTIATKHQELARILKFGIAYRSFTLVHDHWAKNKKWCLIELGGMALLHHGLTMTRGGFVESTVHELLGHVSGEAP